jgi:hypothetical protein
MSWSELRADRVLREINALCSGSLAPLELLSQTATIFDQAVPADASCWSTFDPATTMVTSAVGRNLDERGSAAVRFFELEYASSSPSQYRDLLSAGRDTAVIVADEPEAGDDPEGHAAVREHLDDLGIAVELRVLFRHQGAGWGGAGLMRASGSKPFTVEEVDFASTVLRC